jgi:integrase
MPRRAAKTKGISVRYDRSKQLWRIWFEIKGQIWSESHSTEALARAAAAEYARRLAKGDDIRPARLREKPKAVLAPMAGTVRAEGNAWIIERQRRKKAGTNDFYAGLLADHIYPALGDLPVTSERLTRRVCIDFAKALVGKVSTRTKRPIKLGTRKGIVLTLSAFCGWARDQHPDTLGFNPADDLLEYISDADELPTPMVVWTHQQVDALLKATLERKPHWYAFLYVALKTGLRAGELIELHWDQDFEIPGHVFVQRQYQVRPRKTYAEDADGQLTSERTRGAVQVVPTKGRQSREVPLRADVQLVLSRHRTAQKAWALKHAQSVPALCFTGERGARVAVRNFERRILPKLCIWAKVPYTTKLHTTRHTFATVLLSAGVALGDVSTWLGHASEATTERHYKHFIRDRRREAEIGKLVDKAWTVTR